jgi:hypothetical protein
MLPSNLGGVELMKDHLSQAKTEFYYVVLGRVRVVAHFSYVIGGDTLSRRKRDPQSKRDAE